MIRFLTSTWKNTIFLININLKKTTGFVLPYHSWDAMHDQRTSPSTLSLTLSLSIVCTSPFLIVWPQLRYVAWWLNHLWSSFVLLSVKFWLREFQEFEDKLAAINRTTGVGKQLRDMLKVWCRCLNKPLVGSLEYKQIIEADQELVINICRLQ